MTVGELIEQLEDFGDHIPVVITDARDGENEKRYPNFTVDDFSVLGEPTVELVIE